MKKMLLTAAGFENPRIGEEFLRLTSKTADQIRVLFIPTAAITNEQMQFVAESRSELIQVGVKNEHIQVYNLDYQITYEDAATCDAIYVCGGNTLHLLTQMREVQFDNTLKELIQNGRIYLGVSAGSIVVGPKVRDQSGLHIIDTVIFPHYVEDLRERVETLEKQTGYRVTPLTDMEALLIKGDEQTVIA